MSNNHRKAIPSYVYAIAGASAGLSNGWYIYSLYYKIGYFY